MKITEKKLDWVLKEINAIFVNKNLKFRLGVVKQQKQANRYMITKHQDDDPTHYRFISKDFLTIRECYYMLNGIQATLRML